jgi:hypothetical protein
VAVEQPKLSNRDQNKLALEIAIFTVVGVLSAGVVGPIVLAIAIGKIWGH